MGSTRAWQAGTGRVRDAAGLQSEQERSAKEVRRAASCLVFRKLSSIVREGPWEEASLLASDRELPRGTVGLLMVRRGEAPVE
jgi:hypothetical protein